VPQTPGTSLPGPSSVHAAAQGPLSGHPDLPRLPASQQHAAAMVPTRRSPPRRDDADVLLPTDRPRVLSLWPFVADGAWPAGLARPSQAAVNRFDGWLQDSIAAVRDTGRSVETQLQQKKAVRNRADAEPFVGGLYQALDAGTLDAGWSHPQYRWNHVHVAAAAGDAELVRALIRHGVAPNMADWEGMTPLHLAAASGSAESIELLLAHQANPSAPGARGFLPLHFAAQEGNAASVAALLKPRRGGFPAPNVDARHPASGWAASHFAANRKKHDVLRTLAAAGANLQLADNHGRTVHDVLRMAD
jgi:hypothetical protein